MRNDFPVSNIFDLGAGRYPHIKMTRERFPRLLATRRIEEDDTAEYFGAFLTKTAVRILIDFLNKTFRLRTCDLELDGTFPVPCTQHFRRRCLAPCVASICSEKEYNQIAALARLFVADERTLLSSALKNIIAQRSEELDFEQAAYFRDILLAAEKFWEQKRWQVWLDDTIDTFAVEDTPAGYAIFLVTHRGRNVLGRKVFTVDREDVESSDLAFAQIIDDFYRFHLPKEIRVSRDFVGRRELTRTLSARFSKDIKILIVNPATRGVNAARGLHLNRDEHELDKAKPLATPDVISSKLAKMFGLSNPPLRIEAFDVAHISGTSFVGASSVWIGGHFESTLYREYMSETSTELSTLADAVISRLADRTDTVPDLVILDGGKPQLNAVLKRTQAAGFEDVPIVAAVKPKGKHSSIASFLSTDNDPISFDVNSPAHAMLQLLRDEAHDLANRTHRDYREMIPFYELLGNYKPLIIPIRYHAENGGAEDLRPLPVRV